MDSLHLSHLLLRSVELLSAGVGWGVYSLHLRKLAVFDSSHVDHLGQVYVEPLGYVPPGLLILGLPQWREFPRLGWESLLPIFLAAPYKVCEGREG